MGPFCCRTRASGFKCLVRVCGLAPRRAVQWCYVELCDAVWSCVELCGAMWSSSLWLAPRRVGAALLFFATHQRPTSPAPCGAARGAAPGCHGAGAPWRCWRCCWCCWWWWGVAVAVAAAPAWLTRTRPGAASLCRCRGRRPGTGRLPFRAVPMPKALGKRVLVRRQHDVVRAAVTKRAMGVELFKLLPEV